MQYRRLGRTGCKHSATTRWVRLTRFAIREVRLALRNLVTLREIRYILFAALTCAVGLIGLRSAPWAHNAVVSLGAAVLGGVGCAVWMAAAPAHTQAQSRWEQSDARVVLVIVGVVAAITVLAFYLPMRAHFWLGGDEARVLNDYTQGLASIARYDMMFSRPLTPLGILIGGLFLAPTGVEGFLIWATIVRVASALFFVGIVRLLLPNSWIIPFAAGLLFIVNPSEPTRFAAIHMQGYHMLLLLMLLATFLFLLSYRSASRWLLLGAMVALGAACLVVEVAFVMALVMPLMLLRGSVRQRTTIWLFAWLITLLLFALRLLLHGDSLEYQTVVVNQPLALSQLIDNFFIQFTPLFSFFRIANAAPWQWLIAVGVGSTAALVLVWTSRYSQRSSSRSLIVMSVLCLGYILLSFSMFITLTGFVAQLRTQFAPSPGQALFWVLILALLTTRVSRPNTVFALAVGVMVMLCTVNGFSDETRSTHVAPNTRYEAVVRTIHDVRAVSPRYNANVTIVFYLEPGAQSPLGWQYLVGDLSPLVFDGRGRLLELEGNEDILIQDLSAEWLVAFQLASDGSATLLETLPDNGDFSPDELRQYDPESHFVEETTPPPLLRFFLPEPER